MYSKNVIHQWLKVMFKTWAQQRFYRKMNICKKKVALVFIFRSLFCDHNNYIYFMYRERIVRNYEKKIRFTFIFAINRHSYLGRKKWVFTIRCNIQGAQFYVLLRNTRTCTMYACTYLRSKNILTLKEAIQMNINKFLASWRKSISSLRQKHGPIE